MEVISIDVVDATTALRRRWKTLVAAALAAGIGGGVLASVLPPVWQSEANIEIGAAYGTTLEDPRILARFLESDAFRRSLPAHLTSSVANPVRAQVVDTGGGGPVAYLRILANGRTSEQAHAVAQHVVEIIKARHAPMYAAAVSEFVEFQNTLSGALKELNGGMSRLQGTLERQRKETRD